MSVKYNLLGLLGRIAKPRCMEAERNGAMRQWK